MPRCYIIAGPNGAGKTTFAKTYLPGLGVYHFANADEIAKELSPLNPDAALSEAGRQYLREIENYISSKEDFAFETTLSGRKDLKLIDRLKREGWEVGLYYLVVQSVKVSKARVAERVAHGGHNIPIAAIERRFSRSLRNLRYRYSMKLTVASAT